MVRVIYFILSFKTLITLQGLLVIQAGTREKMTMNRIVYIPAVRCKLKNYKLTECADKFFLSTYRNFKHKTLSKIGFFNHLCNF